MLFRSILRTLLEPAKDPLRDSFGLSLERVRELRVRLQAQIRELRSRAGSVQDPAFEEQIRQLEAEQDKLAQVERRVSGELDHHQARRDLLAARETAAQAQDRLEDLVAALDDAHARAAALAETAAEPLPNQIHAWEREQTK